MSCDDFKDTPKHEEKAKNPILSHYSSGHYYCILRIGRKYKSLGQIQGFVKHMERLQDTPNANTNIKNEILVGNKDVGLHIKSYTQDVKYIRPDTTLAREMLLTASPQFFQGMPEEQKNLWIEKNIEWLQKEFGSNLVYCCYHKDEKTPHLHILICPKVWNEKRKCYTLSNTHYFDGIDKFRAWQDRYAIEMQNTFKSLHRGIRYSKSFNVKIKHFYAILNMKFNETDLEQLCAKAKNSELLEMKIKAVEKTMEAYKKNFYAKDKQALELQKDKKELTRNIKALKENKELFHEALEVLSQRYKLPQNAIKEVLRYVENENEIERS